MADTGEGPPGRALRRSLGQLLVVVVAIALVGAGAGYLFGRTDPQRAARLLIRDFVQTEPEGEVTGLPAPTSGTPDGPPTCGYVTEPLGLEAQVNAIVAGIVVVQFRDEDDASVLSAFAADHGRRTLVAPNPELVPRVVATAWGRRMRLSDPNVELLSAFVQAHAGFGPAAAACG